jgi:dephospho-CoA kinase
VPVLGITGGIATGKSAAVASLLRHLPAEVFDSDRCAHDLLQSDPAAIEAVRETFGAGAFDAEGRVSRPHLRAIVFSDDERRKSLERILHPLIRARWLRLTEQFRSRAAWVFVDIPLLFETGAQAHLDRTLTVACSPEVQRRRLREDRGLTEVLIEKIIGAQLPLGAKIKLADHIIWNDSTVSCLDRQAGQLARWLSQYYG